MPAGVDIGLDDDDELAEQDEESLRRREEGGVNSDDDGSSEELSASGLCEERPAIMSMRSDSGGKSESLSIEKDERPCCSLLAQSLDSVCCSC